MLGLVGRAMIPKPGHMSYGQNYWQGQRTWILHEDSSRVDDIVPIWNPTSILNINVAPLSMMLTVAYLRIFQKSGAPNTDPKLMGPLIKDPVLGTPTFRNSHMTLLSKIFTAVHT